MAYIREGARSEARDYDQAHPESSCSPHNQHPETSPPRTPTSPCKYGPSTPASRAVDRIAAWQRPLGHEQRTVLVDLLEQGAIRVEDGAPGPALAALVERDLAEAHDSTYRPSRFAMFVYRSQLQKNRHAA